MTNETAAPNSLFDARDLLSSLRNGVAMLAKVIMGGLVVVAAGILAVALATVGLILASVAVVYRMASGQPNRDVPVSDGDGIILEARPTPHGWTVE